MMKMAMLKQLFEDDQFIERYIAVFKVETPKMIQSIFDSLKNDDFEHVSIIAHGLKSQLAYLESDQALLIATKIEHLAEHSGQQNKEKLEYYAVQLRALLNQVLAEL